MDSQVARLGGTSAIGVAVLFPVISVNHLFRPAAVTPVEVMEQLVSNPIYHYVNALGFALVALLMIPVITALSQSLQQVNAGWVRWAAIVGYIDSASTMMTHFRLLRLVPIRAQAFMEGDEMVRAAIQYNWFGNSLDPDGWLFFGGFGFFLLVIAWAALRVESRFPRAYGHVSLVTAGILVLALGRIAAPALGQVVAGLGGLVLAPIWSAWTGILLRRTAA